MIRVPCPRCGYPVELPDPGRSYQTTRDCWLEVLGKEDTKYLVYVLYEKEPESVRVVFSRVPLSLAPGLTTT